MSVTDTNQALSEADLNLVATQADAAKDEEELWDEMDAEEDGNDDPADRDRLTVVSDEDDQNEDQDDDDDDQEDDGSETSQNTDEEAAGADASKSAEPGEGGNEELADIWANASDEQRAAFDALSAEAEDLKHSLNSNKGRVSALSKQVNTLVGKVRELAKPEAPNPKNAVDALKGLSTEYPEIAGPLQTVLDTVQAQLDEIKTEDDRRQKASDIDFEANVEVETAAMEAAHPGYQKFLGDNWEAFVSWANGQDDNVRQVFFENQESIVDANAASKLVNSFKQHLASPAPKPNPAPAKTDQAAKQEETAEQDDADPNPLESKRRRQLEASASPQGKGRGPTLSGIPEDGDEEAIWDAFEALDGDDED